MSDTSLTYPGRPLGENSFTFSLDYVLELILHTVVKTTDSKMNIYLLLCLESVSIDTVLCKYTTYLRARSE